MEYDGNELDNEGGDTTGKASRLPHVRSMTQYNSMIFNILEDPDEALRIEVTGKLEVISGPTVCWQKQ